MNKTLPMLALATIVAAAGGYWLGQERAVGKPAGTSAAKAERKLLYYRNPMGLADTSPVPKKDPMGMDYVPVYEGADDKASEPAGTVRLSPDKIQKLGVRTEAAQLRALDSVLRAVGRVEVDERQTHTVSPRFEGWIDRLHVNATGQPVRRGQPLLEVYSPDLLSAQREYAIAAAGAESLKASDNDAHGAMKQIADAGLARLKNWDIPDDQIALLKKGGDARRTLTLRAPVDGVVMEKKAVQGARFMPGEVLFQIADLSRVWVVADVFEQDLARVHPGQQTKLKFNAYPNRTFVGKVAYIYPTENPQTRTIPVRLELANPQGLLKPAMYAEVELAAGKAEPVLCVPTSAVIQSGRRQIVLVQLAGDAGRFEPRSVELGRQGDDYVEIRSGIQAGDKVVVSANFLIDSESNLKAALSGFGQADKGAGVPGKGTAVQHGGRGVVKQIDAARASITLDHQAIASLNWPAMVMPFAVKAPATLAGLAPGDQVEFELAEQSPGDFAIIKLNKTGGGQ